MEWTGDGEISADNESKKRPHDASLRRKKYIMQ